MVENFMKTVATKNGVEQIPLTPEEVTQRKAEITAYEAETPRRTAIEEIQRLEKDVTQRRLREAALGTDNGWMANQESLIAVQRSILANL